MNWKHLLYIIPLSLIIGIIIGYMTGMYTINTLSTLVESIDECSLQTLEYTSNQNTDCKILITGYLKQCTENLTITT